MSKKRKFVQISADGGLLYALDAAGNVWELRGHKSYQSGPNGAVETYTESWHPVTAERQLIT